jgi:hypothetical protein
MAYIHRSPFHCEFLPIDNKTVNLTFLKTETLLDDFSHLQNMHIVPALWISFNMSEGTRMQESHIICSNFERIPVAFHPVAFPKIIKPNV